MYTPLDCHVSAVYILSGILIHGGRANISQGRIDTTVHEATHLKESKDLPEGLCGTAAAFEWLIGMPWSV